MAGGNRKAAAIDSSKVLAFLPCRTPESWVGTALGGLDTLLHDHAALELKAARQAQSLIIRYGTAAAHGLPDAFRSRLVQCMSRLAREELRHFEQVVALIERRGGNFTRLSPSRYAAGLHALARAGEPGALVDTLIIGAVIEARSCERFERLVGPLEAVEPELAHFYRSLLRSEARHFEDYLTLAAAVDQEDCARRQPVFLARDAELVTSPDTELRFHSGPVVPTTPPRSHWHVADHDATRRSRAGTRR